MTENSSNPEVPKISTEAKEAGHKLYQWVWRRLAEGESVEPEEVESFLADKQLTPEVELDAMEVAKSEADYRFEDIADGLAEEDNEVQRRIYEHAYLTIDQAVLDRMSKSY